MSETRTKNVNAKIFGNMIKHTLSLYDIAKFSWRTKLVARILGTAFVFCVIKHFLWAIVCISRPTLCPVIPCYVSLCRLF